MKKKVIRAAAFLLIFGILFLWTTDVFYAKTESAFNIIFKDLYKLPKDSVELCELGSSQIVSGLNSMKLYEDYGISGYSIGGGDQPVMMSYYWLREMCKRQPITTAVMDVSMLYEKVEEERMRTNLDGMRFSPLKAELILEYASMEETETFEKSDTVFSYLFNIVNYHSRWKELTDIDFDIYRNKELPWRGNRMIPIAYKSDIPYEEFIIDNQADGVKETVPEQKEYFVRIVEFCRENNIQLILIKTPKATWDMASHNGIQVLADEYGLPFLDFNTDAMLKEIGFNYAQDMRNYNHMNIRGMDKLTDYMAKYLLDRYEFTDYREQNKKYPFSEEAYHGKYKDNYLLTTTDLQEVFSYLKDTRYDIVMQATGNISGVWQEEYNTYLEEMGITLDIASLTKQNYIIVIHGGNMVYEEVSDEAIEYEGEFSDGRPFVLKSSLKAKEEDMAVRLGSISKKFGRKGLNILIYDNKTGKTVDTPTFYPNKDNQKLLVVHNPHH